MQLYSKRDDLKRSVFSDSNQPKNWNLIPQEREVVTTRRGTAVPGLQERQSRMSFQGYEDYRFFCYQTLPRARVSVGVVCVCVCVCVCVRVVCVCVVRACVRV